MSLIRNYIFWKYERGSFHYDVMVTMILAFVFIAPHFIDFKDKPAPVVPVHSSQVLVKEAGSQGASARFVYEIHVDDLRGATTDADIRAAILRVIEPIAGNVTLEGYTPVTDVHGNIVAYDATVVR